MTRAMQSNSYAIALPPAHEIRPAENHGQAHHVRPRVSHAQPSACLAYAEQGHGSAKRVPARRVVRGPTGVPATNCPQGDAQRSFCSSDSQLSLGKCGACRVLRVRRFAWRFLRFSPMRLPARRRLLFLGGPSAVSGFIVAVRIRVAV